MTAPSTRRMFVAVVPSDDALEHLDVVAAPMRLERPDLRWVAPRLLHVTLAFMPDVPEPLADELPDVLAAVGAATAPIRLNLEGSGRFDERVLWTGIGTDPDGLVSLADRTVRALAAAGAAPQRHVFRPHLTLARRSGSLDAQLGGLASRLDDYAGPLWQVDALRLVRSYLGRGVRHEVVAEVPLTG